MVLALGVVLGDPLLSAAVVGLWLNVEIFRDWF